MDAVSVGADLALCCLYLQCHCPTNSGWVVPRHAVPVRGSIWQSYAHPSVSPFPSCFLFCAFPGLGMDHSDLCHKIPVHLSIGHGLFRENSVSPIREFSLDLLALLSWHGSLGASGLKIPGEVPLKEQENGFCSLLNLGRNVLQTERNAGDFLREAEITNYIGLLQKTLDRRHNTVIFLELGFN